MGKKSGRPGLGLEEAERVRAAMQRILTERYGDNRTALGKDLGLTQPSITYILEGTHRASIETARRLALLDGVHFSEYLDPGPRTHIDDRWPSKDGAVLAANAVKLPAAAIQRMIAETLPDVSVDPGPHFWLLRVEAYASLPEGGDDRPPPAPRPSGSGSVARPVVGRVGRNRR